MCSIVYSQVCSDVDHPEASDMMMKSCLINTHDDLATITDTAALELRFTETNTVDFNQFIIDTPNLNYLVFHMTHLLAVELKGAMDGLGTTNLQTLTIKRDLTEESGSFYLYGQTFSALKSLETLTMNSIGIGLLDKKAFHGLYSLDVLDLSENYLAELPEGVLQDCYNLTILRLQDNFITPSNLLENSFAGPTDLHWLNLENNKINYLPNDRLKQLQSLSILVLTNNELTFVEDGAFNGLTNLHYLSLSTNKLQFVPSEALAKIPDLFSLDLSLNELENDLQPRDFEGLSSLEILYLQYTNLGDVSGDSFIGLTKLRELHLKGNQIQNINASTFQYMPQLVHADLADNKISSVAVDTFSSLSNLKVLNLADNELSTLEEGVFDDVEELEELYLSGNRWNCSCDMLWMFQWINDNEERLSNEHELYTIKCSLPEQYQHYTFYNLRYSFVMGCQEELTGLDITTESQVVHGEESGGLTRKQLYGIIAGVVVFFIVMVMVISTIVYVHRKKHRFWKPARSQQDISRTSEQMDREQRLARHRTPSWCKEPAPVLPPRGEYPTTSSPRGPAPSAPTPEQQDNRQNEVFAFDNMALETSMISKNGMSPTKSNGSAATSPIGYGDLGRDFHQAGAEASRGPADVHIDMNKNGAASPPPYAAGY